MALALQLHSRDKEVPAVQAVQVVVQEVMGTVEVEVTAAEEVALAEAAEQTRNTT